MNTDLREELMSLIEYSLKRQKITFKIKLSLHNKFRSATAFSETLEKLKFLYLQRISQFLISNENSRN